MSNIKLQINSLQKEASCELLEKWTTKIMSAPVNILITVLRHLLFSLVTLRCGTLEPEYWYTRTITTITMPKIKSAKINFTIPELLPTKAKTRGSPTRASQNPAATTQKIKVGNIETNTIFITSACWAKITHKQYIYDNHIDIKICNNSRVSRPCDKSIFLLQQCWKSLSKSQLSARLL